MLELADKAGNITAYLYQNLIIDTASGVVNGIILGNCVFGIAGKMVGKFVHDNLYTVNGEIAAQRLLKESERSFPKDAAKHLQQGWIIASKVKDHVAPWIEISGNWSVLGLPDILRQ